ncbi:MAG: FGGY family carbohydrate kinase [Bacteroidales bacterium]
MYEDCVIGLDFGTDSARGVLVDSTSGEVVSSASSSYRLWAEGRFCRPEIQQFRQNPTDYIMSMMKVMSDLFKGKDEYLKSVSGIGIDRTASTVCLVGKDGSPLSLAREHMDDPDAMFILWKDHTAQEEVEPIEKACAEAPVNYIRHSGGRYSLECFWAKVYHIVRTRPELAREAYAAMDLCDWLTGCLIGAEKYEDYKFGRCIAASKEMWAPEWNGLPPKEFFAQFDPELERIAGNMVSDNATSDCCAGTLCKEFAEQFGLPENVKVGYGMVDSHCGAIGSGISEGTIVVNLGTSAGIMAIMPKEKIGDSIIPGVYGQAEDLIVPGYIGYEDGPTAFGDIFAWYKRLLAYGRTPEEADRILPKLDDDASVRKVSMRTPVSVDWLNGRRSPDPNGALRGMIAGLHKSTFEAEDAMCAPVSRIYAPDKSKAEILENRYKAYKAGREAFSTGVETLNGNRDGGS